MKFLKFVVILGLFMSIAHAADLPHQPDAMRRVRLADGVFVGPGNNYLNRQIGERCILPGATVKLLGNSEEQGTLVKVVAVEYEKRMEGATCPAGSLVFVEKYQLDDANHGSVLESRRSSDKVVNAALEVLSR